MLSLKPDKIKNVLVYMSDKHMGNFVVSLPSIRALNKFFRDKNFFIIVDSAYAEIIEALPGSYNVILYPRQLLNYGPWLSRVTAMAKFLWQTRKSAPDVAIDLEGRHTSSTLMFLTGARIRIGRSSAQRAYFYNMKVDISEEERHRVFRYCETASAIGAPCDNMTHVLKSTESQRGSLTEKLARTGIDLHKPVACIHPGAGRVFRQWTSEGFAGISDWLTMKGFQTVFIGGRGDLQKVSEVTSLLEYQSYNVGGMLSLGELTALFEISSLYIGNDSGPLHLASAVGTMPVVGLFFRPGSDRTWYPFSEKSLILRGDAGCETCKQNHCPYNFQCVRNLSFNEVRSAIAKLLISQNATSRTM